MGTYGTHRSKAVYHFVHRIPAGTHVVQQLKKVQLNHFALLLEPSARIAISDEILESIPSLAGSSHCGDNLSAECNWIACEGLFYGLVAGGSVILVLDIPVFIIN